MASVSVRPLATKIGSLATAVVVGSVIAPAPVKAHSHRDYRKERAHVEERARTQRGTRYTYAGTSPRSGFDCSGFTRWIYLDHGAELPHSSIDQFYMARRKGHKRIWKRSNLEVGDLVFFKTTSRRVGHAGMYIGNGRFIHSSSAGGGVRIDSVWDRYYYGPRFVGATRLPATIRYSP